MKREQIEQTMGLVKTIGHLARRDTSSGTASNPVTQKLAELNDTITRMEATIRAELEKHLDTHVEPLVPGVPLVDEPGIIYKLAVFPSDTILSSNALGKIFHKHPKSIQRAVRRGEFPAPFLHLRQHVWLAGAIVADLRKRQEKALKEASTWGR